MKVFHIFLAIKPLFEEVENQQRVFAGVVEADDLEQAFAKSQNSVRYWNRSKPCRSVSVGDVIEENGNMHMVCNFGFKKISI